MFDGDIKDILKIMHFNDKNYIYKFENYFGFGYLPPINKENEINVLKKLKVLLIQALGQYTTTLEQDKKVYNEDKNLPLNYKNCLLLIMSEKSVITHYIYFCDFCLDVLKVKNRKELIEKLSVNINDFQYEFYIQEALLKLIKE